MKKTMMMTALLAAGACLTGAAQIDDATLRARYEDELYNRVVPFWVEHSIDRDCGGYLTCLDRAGNVYDTTKDVWLEWREVYMFAALNNRGRRHPEWVTLAKHGYDFLYAKARHADGSYATVMNRDGSKTSTAAPLVGIFSHAFAAMGCAELYRATGEGKYREEALSCWRHYRRIWATSEGEWRQLSYRVLGLNVMNVFNNCFAGAFADEARAIAAEMPRFVEPTTGLMLERVKPDWTHDLSSQYGRFVNSGHTVEAMSFLFDHIAITGDRTLLDFGVKTALKMYDFGWDAEKGGGFVYRDALGKPCDKTDWMLKTWWADCEAATAMLRGWKLTGDRRFLERFKTIDAYDWANFRDPDFPEWFAYAPVEGRRCHTYKGNVRKGFFHLPRRLIDCLELMGDGGASPRAFVGIPAVAVASNGRLWATWYAGPTPGEDENNYIVLATSIDGGRHWKEVVRDDPDGIGPVHYGDPQLWIAPDGRLLWFAVRHEYDKSSAHPAQMVMTEFANATEENPSRAPQRRLMPGCMAVKPFVAPDGAWILPVCVWKDAQSTKVYESKDGLKTWRLRGETGVAEAGIRSSDESAVTAGADGKWHIFLRTSKGLYESFSSDAGHTWTPAAPATTVRHTPARLACRTLKSGNVLLVKHGKVDEQCPRERLTAYLSTDGGKSWKGGLMLDERSSVSYPDANQATDGTIYVAYDRDRIGAREINLAIFTEADVLAGRNVSGKVLLKRPVSRGAGRGIYPPEYVGPVKGRYHAPETRAFIGKPQIVRTPGGRQWATWMAAQEACEDHNTYVVLATSTDDGKTWREQLIADPDFMWSRRAFAPAVAVKDGQIVWSWRDEVTWNWCAPDAVRPLAQLWQLKFPAEADVTDKPQPSFAGLVAWNAPDVVRDERVINQPSKLDDISGKIWSFDVRAPARTDRVE